MKKIFIFLFAAALCTLASAQGVDQGRDLSKYADDKFGLDDQYTVTTPYPTITLGPVRSNLGLPPVPAVRDQPLERRADAERRLDGCFRTVYQLEIATG